MVQVNPKPNEDTLEKRREPKFVVNPKNVAKKDDIRMREWALGIMQKHLSRLDDKVPNKTIVFEKEVEPEEINIMNIYPFAKKPFGEIRYFIMKKDQFWILRLLYKTPSRGYAILAEFTYANVDHI